MAVTLRFPSDLEAELIQAAREDHCSPNQIAALAVQTYLALRETAEIKADRTRCGRWPKHARP